jgi:hypothetical protein
MKEHILVYYLSYYINAPTAAYCSFGRSPNKTYQAGSCK